MDNVSYLRACATNEPSERDADQLMECAAEITRLRAEVERLTQSRDGYAKQANGRAAECDRLRSAFSEAGASIRDAHTYAERLAVSLHSKYYSGNTEWRPLSGDLIGILTQIDNMTAGLLRRATPDEVSALHAAIRASKDAGGGE